ncbi:ShlB/FhaC/HecB family hemolysin secretion/activation protein [Desulfatirhabdium butyrativorans]|uniref:ShlB/FhaC/HecB family hemolysin secretion/activation protein n=1 Tax=Desulfatirhabdium butyrativorans TaxID=340467 RepID=UPI00146FC487|nr:ShlB/FhaC/HecB family hemolysin secretion/activation protein [Desulfatirhabdium butyrativorans]
MESVPESHFVLPPVDTGNIPPSAHPALRVHIRLIQFSGNQVFSSEELMNVANPFLDRELSAEDIESLRHQLTLYYIEHGYINSGALIPDQSIQDGLLEVRIVEGELSAIHVETSGRLWPGYVRNRLLLDAGPPFNIFDLQRRMQLLQSDIHIERLNAELKPGDRRGRAELDVKVQEALPYQVWLRANNYQSPSIGSERGEITGVHNNVTGIGDQASLTVGGSEGVFPKLDIGYSIPLNAYETTLSLQYRKNNYDAIEKRFDPLDIKSTSNIYTISLRQPLYRNLSHEFAVGLTLEHLENETSLLGEPFSLTYGAVNGKSKVTALRCTQEYVYRSMSQVLAFSSKISYGLDFWDATIHDGDIPDSRYLAWLGQFQWVRKYNFWDSQTVFRTDIQIANEPLLSLEQIAVGGRYSVRGYRENQMVRDNAVISSIEWRIPVVQDKSWADMVQLAPFIDYGRAWNTKLDTPDPKDLTSIGIGLRWERKFKPPHTIHPQFEIYWGIPLRHIDSGTEWNLQDAGIHFQVSLAVF